MLATHLLRINIVWLLLIVATTLSYGMEWLLSNGDRGFSKNSVLAVIVITVLKVRLVILDFMELRHAPLTLRLINELWIISLGVMLIYIWW